MEAFVAQSKYHPSIYPERLKKTMKNFSQQVFWLRIEFSTSQIYKYKSIALPIDQPVQFIAVARGLNFFLVVYVTCIHSKPGDLIIVFKWWIHISWSVIIWLIMWSTFLMILVQNAIMDVQTVMYWLFVMFFENAPCTDFMEMKPNTDSLIDRAMTDLHVAWYFSDSHSPAVMTGALFPSARDVQGTLVSLHEWNLFSHFRTFQYPYQYTKSAVPEQSP